MKNRKAFHVWDDEGKMHLIAAQGNGVIVASPEPMERGQVQYAVRLEHDGSLTVWTNTEPWVHGDDMYNGPQWEMRCSLDLKNEIAIRELAQLGSKS